MALHTYALRRPFSLSEPHVVPIRPKENFHIQCACSDAFAEGFAQAVCPNLSIEEQDGNWLPEILERSSTLHKVFNIANHLRQDIKANTMATS
jgi:hypothetical protein